MTKCEWQAKATAIILTSGVKWRLNIIKSEHNYLIDINPSLEPAYRKCEEHVFLIIMAIADSNHTL